MYKILINFIGIWKINWFKPTDIGNNFIVLVRNKLIILEIQNVKNKNK